ncbi:Terminase small subunit [compost metagenome]
MDLNATQAYMRAFPGVKSTTASTEGTRLLGNPWIAEAIAKARLALQERTQVTAGRVMLGTRLLVNVGVHGRDPSRPQHCDGRADGSGSDTSTPSGNQVTRRGCSKFSLEAKLRHLHSQDFLCLNRHSPCPKKVW